jgi:hypothetical protein
MGDQNYDALYDFDNDGDIDIVDIMIVAVQWGWTQQTSGSHELSTDDVDPYH